jgi:hypothetical protein
VLFDHDRRGLGGLGVIVRRRREHVHGGDRCRRVGAARDCFNVAAGNADVGEQTLVEAEQVRAQRAGAEMALDAFGNGLVEEAEALPKVQVASVLITKFCRHNAIQHHGTRLREPNDVVLKTMVHGRLGHGRYFQKRC